jgi:Protein of unknown function (DUF3105)
VLRRWVSVILAASVLVSPVACGGDDDGGGGAEASERVPTNGGDPIEPAQEGVEGVEAFAVPNRNHTEEPLDYSHKPPVGGDHFFVPGTCGFYRADPPPVEYIVHDLEHGAVWIAYRPDVPDAQLATLRDLAAQQAKVIITPYEEMDSPITVSSWGRQLALDSVDDPRLQQFIATYRNGPLTPEPAAPCFGAGNPEVASPQA